MKKIVVLGPESTGKSTLCELLSAHYNAPWVREYAREYLLKHGTNYSFDDLLSIAKGQLKGEDEVVNSVDSPVVFIDTDMHVMKVWCEFVFGETHPFILKELNERKYDLYLLCNIDLPWVKDELREYPDLETRSKLYDIYKNIMINEELPWVDISGDYDQRVAKAISAVDSILK